MIITIAIILVLFLLSIYIYPLFKYIFVCWSDCSVMAWEPKLISEAGAGGGGGGMGVGDSTKQANKQQKNTKCLYKCRELIVFFCIFFC